MGNLVSFLLERMSNKFINAGRVSPGYSKTASPVQAIPRKASVITQPIRGIVMSVSFSIESNVVRDKLTTNFGFLGYSDGMPVRDWRGGVRMEWRCFEDQVWQSL